ncbi:SDR family NAD(P)-dependent oxidoreductase [Bradyrhizobium elkanii]|uniref:NAD(P)-dependent dehydrogenase (Short-subunit alcohol dehydrogenase family) n=1 Tax=Bradyrhizobium elkanii TaxID=29448 RepID=A0ABV4F7I9_BRAEL|nr:SDR family NAD(P)-dependent oxidoreductase [Bradyrhizobium elkanii]MCP1751001.1 3-oxoacyl-[acyl-carrier protein] reductase [Bradyrhizobium elkanii]MCP1976773.1 3-oxoacyl-[acyl-carrier protein] reductase [Bradyrhizobium elkanii]MCS3888709.1 3-oxoacyl-[acyl-carrier protein] reductase [Bradyrhizobium elkanii]MCS4212269.1 3-oxoacyl-[acyl-carrier protein] reductase [Bradyrhizobium elkanii]MCW2192097.1 3-oxoacyl-[acyl-carrier protein] reductase [Bradyrhizobium elkanii]
MRNAVAIVTGASQGIGRATAIRLALDFSGVVLVARSGAKLEETANEVRARGSEPMVLELDMSKPAAPDTVVARTLDRFGRTDALLNIAGSVPQVDILEMTDQQWAAKIKSI